MISWKLVSGVHASSSIDRAHRRTALQRFTYTSGTNSGGKKIVDRDFDAIATLYSHKAKLFGNSDITQVNITPPAAFEFVCALGKGREMGCVSCSHCGYPHLDLGDFARTPHRKHFCANCGRDSTWSKTAIVSTPLKPLHDQYPQAKVFTEPDRSVSPTTTMVVGTPSGPRLPPYFGQPTALKKKEYTFISTTEQNESSTIRIPRFTMPASPYRE